VVTRADDQSALLITKAVMPGNFRIYGADGRALANFSLNVSPDESQLIPIPAERIEALFGPDSVLPVDHKTNLHDALQGHWSQPIELLPWLMMLVLLLLAVENLFANKFYRRETNEEDQANDRHRSDEASAVAN
jgi:hypothetical protein